MTLQEIFNRCRQNDAKAQRLLYDLYRAKLMGLCRRYTRDTDDAKDILQDSFIKIFSNITQLKSWEKLESWVKSVAVRTAIDFYHRSKKNDHHSFDVDDYQVADVNYNSILENLSDEYLISVINDLPEGCRMVFNLFEIEGYSHAEIGGLLNMSEGTSRSQLHHAKHLLKEKLSCLGVYRYEKIA